MIEISYVFLYCIFNTIRFECNSNIGWCYGGNCYGIPLLEAGLSYRIDTDSRAKIIQILERR